MYSRVLPAQRNAGSRTGARLWERSRCSAAPFALPRPRCALRRQGAARARDTSLKGELHRARRESSLVRRSRKTVAFSGVRQAKHTSNILLA